MSQKERYPANVAEFVGPGDFMTDDDGSNDEGDSTAEMKVSRRKIKNIRQKRRQHQSPPNKKKTAREPLTPSATRAEPTDSLTREKRAQSHVVPAKPKLLPIRLQLPPLPELKSCSLMDLGP